MGHYLVEGTFGSAAAKAMIASPNDRSIAARTLIESLGGRFHHYFFVVGETRYVVLAEFPDDMGATAASLAIDASGAFSRTKVTKLLTVADAQAAMVKAQSARYTPPTAS